MGSTIVLSLPLPCSRVPSLCLSLKNKHQDKTRQESDCASLFLKLSMVSRLPREEKPEVLRAVHEVPGDQVLTATSCPPHLTPCPLAQPHLAPDPGEPWPCVERRVLTWSDSFFSEAPLQTGFCGTPHLARVTHTHCLCPLPCHSFLLRLSASYSFACRLSPLWVQERRCVHSCTPSDSHSVWSKCVINIY